MDLGVDGGLTGISRIGLMTRQEVELRREAYSE